MKIGCPKEIKSQEFRVGLIPAAVKFYVEKGHQVCVETTAGAGSGIPDEQYRAAGAKICATAGEVWKWAGMIVKVFGRIVVLFLFGESLAAAFNKRSISPIAAVLLGLLVFGFIGFVPVLGFFFSFVMGIMGWGIALRTKFGTVENWFHRGPRPFVQAPPAPPAPPEKKEAAAV